MHVAVMIFTFTNADNALLTAVPAVRSALPRQVVPFHGTFDDYKKRLRGLAKH